MRGHTASPSVSQAAAVTLREAAARPRCGRLAGREGCSLPVVGDENVRGQMVAGLDRKLRGSFSGGNDAVKGTFHSHGSVHAQHAWLSMQWPRALYERTAMDAVLTMTG
eukprot:352470-Chlamydomonas_euryale.AAC.15